MRIDWKERGCPNCGSEKKSENAIAQSSIPAESLSFDDVKQSFIGLRKEQVFFSYFRCTECSLLYAPKYFSEVQLAELYREMPDNLMGEDKSTISRTQAQYVQWAKRRRIRPSSYLEIGPDIGLVSREIVRAFPIEKATLIEPNIASHRELIDSVSSVNSVGIFEYLKEIPENPTYDLIAGVHVYDHLLNPLSDLRKLHDLSNTGSNLLVVVHDEKSLLRKLLKAKWPPFCLQHPQLYNPQTLEKILFRSGWRLSKVSKSTNWWHLNHFAKLGSSVLGLPSNWSKWMPPLELPLRLGNIIALAERLP